MGNCWGTRVKAESPAHCTSSTSTSSSGKSLVETKISRDICSRNSSCRSSSSYSNSNSQNGSRYSASSNLRCFTFSDLKAATRNFRPDSLLGEGGFGCVFKGWIDEQGFMATKPGTGMVIAVKKLNLEGLQGHKEWLAEVKYLGQLHHSNLVKLIGFCAEDDHRLLVYEFMQRGSLENHLFRRSHNQPLGWSLRMRIAVGAAKGLAFLHEADRQVIYRDFKTSNILLDSEYNAKLSDFGLAKDGPTGDNTHVSTRVMGTYGYAAPEYVATGRLTAKSDIYSFGVVLLEILTGRRAVDKNRPGVEQKLVEWGRPYLADKRKVFRLVDSRLEGQYSMKGAQKVAALAQSCLNPEPKLRPQMRDVVDILEPLMNAREVVRHTPSYYQIGSAVHNTAHYQQRGGLGGNTHYPTHYSQNKAAIPNASYLRDGFIGVKKGNDVIRAKEGTNMC